MMVDFHGNKTLSVAEDAVRAQIPGHAVEPQTIILNH